MSYSVFLVEDEIVAREGMRANVGWGACGFELCGEAADGELALPQLEQLKPDLLITDIRMPFMDGLQLCRLVRERLPQTKVIIVSGYDEFSYAQEAITLGVTEYLLKPISAQDVMQALQRIRQQLDQERADAQRRQQLEQQLIASRPLLQEHFLLELVLGKFDTVDAIERSRQFGLDLLAPCYRIVLTRCEPLAFEPDFASLQTAERVLTDVAAAQANVLVCRKDRQEIIFIVQGASAEEVGRASDALTQGLQAAHALHASWKLTIGNGTDAMRLGELPDSLLAASTAAGQSDGAAPFSLAEPLPLPDQNAVEAFLAAGASQSIDTFLHEQIAPWQPAVERSPLVRNYLLLDIYLTAGRLIEDWGGELSALFPELSNFTALAAKTDGYARFETQIRHVIAATIEFRNQTVDHHQTILIQEARAFIDAQYASPEISLGDVAAHVHLSPSHFSALFSRENGASFREYLTAVRIRHAKELLRGSSLRNYEIANAVGYLDPHYFSTVFKRETGSTPRDFRNGR